MNFLDEEGRLVWHEEKDANNGVALGWREFWENFLKKYNYALVLKEIRQRLQLCYFKGDIDDSILCFWRLSCQIPRDKLSSFELKFLFTNRLPPQYHQELNEIDYKGEEDLELMFQGARECERNYTLARGQSPGKNTSVSQVLLFGDWAH